MVLRDETPDAARQTVFLRQLQTIRDMPDDDSGAIHGIQVFMRVDEARRLVFDKEDRV